MLVGIVPNPYERRSAAHDEPKTEYPDEVLCHGGGKAAHKTERSGTSYKAKLRAAIDRLMPGCNDLEELLRRLQREGYEVKRGKYISCRAPEQERFTRLKTLGADYASHIPHL